METVNTGKEKAEAVSGIRMLHDRVLLKPDVSSNERRSAAGIVIPATAQTGRRLLWASVVAVGQLVRQVETGDRVLFDPENQADVELNGVDYILLRERDLHAVAELDEAGSGTGMYL